MTTRLETRAALIVLELEPAEAARLHMLAEAFAHAVAERPPPPGHGFDPAPALTALRKLDEALTAAGYRLDHIGWRIPREETSDA